MQALMVLKEIAGNLGLKVRNKPRVPKGEPQRDLRSDDGNAEENVNLRNYFNLFNFYRNGELPRNQIGRSGVQVKKVNNKFTAVCCSCSPKTLNFRGLLYSRTLL